MTNSAFFNKDGEQKRKIENHIVSPLSLQESDPLIVRPIKVAIRANTCGTDSDKDVGDVTFWSDTTDTLVLSIPIFISISSSVGVSSTAFIYPF